MSDHSNYLIFSLSAEGAARVAEILAAVSGFHDTLSQVVPAMTEAKTMAEVEDHVERIRRGTVEANALLTDLHEILNSAQGVYGGPIQ